MAFKKPKENEEDNSLASPKLSNSQLEEITSLVERLGSTNKVLEYWRMVKLSRGKVVTILDYSESSANYLEFEPLKGIKYGVMTPYNWGKDWIAQWSQWIDERARYGDITALKFCNPNRKLKREETTYPLNKQEDII